MKKYSLTLLVTVAALTLSPICHAEGYIGLGIGKVDADADDLSNFDDPTGFELFSGGNINENFAIEGFFTDFGEASDGIPPEWDLSAQTLGIAAVGIAPINDKFSLSGRIGFHSWDVELDEEGFGTLAEEDGINITFGIGAMITPTESVAFALRYNQYTFDSGVVDSTPSMLSAAAVFRF